VAKRFSCPENTLVGEIELAVTYLLACNPDIPPSVMVMGKPLGRRAEFAGQIAAMLAERAEKGLSGMRIEDAASAGVPGSKTESSLST
jgi:hypothetical protein